MLNIDERAGVWLVAFVGGGGGGGGGIFIARQNLFNLLNSLLYFEVTLITFYKVGDILLMLACQHIHSRIYSTLPFMTIFCIYQVCFFNY